MAEAVRNLTPWAYWRLRLEEVVATDPCPLDALDTLGAHEATGSADARATFDAWRSRARARLDALLAPWPQPVPLRIELGPETPVGEDVVSRRLVFDSERHMSVPCRLLRPAGRSAPATAVVAVHGHGLDKDLLCGDDGGDARRRALIDENHGDFALALARAGHVVLAPDLRTFGERADRFLPPIDPDDEVADIERHHLDCDYNFVCAELLGEHPLTQNLWDLRRCVDVLAGHPLVDPDRIGVVGWSYGGTLALFLGAVDPRLRATVVSCFFSSWHAAHALPWNMCGSQIVPGLLGAFEHVDLAALVAPRAFMASSGADDHLFPAEVATREIARLRSLYDLLDVPGALHHEVFPGPHRFDAPPIVAFLAAHL